MTEKIDATQSHKVFNYWIAKLGSQFYSNRKYPMTLNSHGQGVVTAAQKIAERVRDQISEDICFTAEQKEQFETDLFAAGNRVNDKSPIVSILNATKNSLGFKPDGINGVKESAWNLFSNAVHGPSAVNDHTIRMETQSIIEGIKDNVQITRGECENCLHNLCSGHRQS